MHALIDSTTDVPEAVFRAVACVQHYLIRPNRPVNISQPKITWFFETANTD